MQTQAMDIRNLNTHQLREQGAGPAKGGEQAKQAESTASPRVDTVELSQDAAALNEVARNQGAEPFDAARVDSIKRAIAEGRYHVDPERLAENFMKLENDLIQ